MYHTAVIGLHMGRQHARAYAETAETQTVALCDTDAETLVRVGDELGVERRVTDWREILDMDDVDVVSVATPDFGHAEQCIACMEAGKHVICEKPMVVSLEECRAVVEAQDRTGQTFMIGQVCRFAPGFALAKQIVDSGEIGDLFYVESEYAHDYQNVGGVGGWRKGPRKREPFLGGGCHAVDLVRWLAGDVDEVFAYSNHMMLKDWPVDDCWIASLKFASGVLGKVFVSVGCKRSYTMRSVFYGSKGTIICDNQSDHIQVYREDLKPLGDGFASVPVCVASHNVQREVEYFVEALRGDHPMEVDAREGARTVATCLAAVESSARGVAVAVERF